MLYTFLLILIQHGEFQATNMRNSISIYDQTLSFHMSFFPFYHPTLWLHQKPGGGIRTTTPAPPARRRPPPAPAPPAAPVPRGRPAPPAASPRQAPRRHGPGRPQPRVPWRNFLGKETGASCVFFSEETWHVFEKHGDCRHEKWGI